MFKNCLQWVGAPELKIASLPPDAAPIGTQPTRVYPRCKPTWLAPRLVAPSRCSPHARGARVTRAASGHPNGPDAASVCWHAKAIGAPKSKIASARHLRPPPILQIGSCQVQVVNVTHYSNGPHGIFGPVQNNRSWRRSGGDESIKQRIGGIVKYGDPLSNIRRQPIQQGLHRHLLQISFNCGQTGPSTTPTNPRGVLRLGVKMCSPTPSQHTWSGTVGSFRVWYSQPM